MNEINEFGREYRSFLLGLYGKNRISTNIYDNDKDPVLEKKKFKATLC